MPPELLPRCSPGSTTAASLRRRTVAGLSGCLRLQQAASFYWYLRRISSNLVINLCHVAHMLKMAACRRLSGTKEALHYGWGGN